MAKPKLDLGSFTGVVAAMGPSGPAEISVDLIDVAQQVRKDLGDLHELINSIKDVGVLEPVLLLGKSDGRYQLIAGERRVRASQQAGLVKVPAIIKRGLSDFEVRRIQVTENNERENLSAYDEAMGVVEDVARFGMDEALRIWNRSNGWLSKRLSVKGYGDQTRDLLKSGLCGDFEVLHCLNQLAKLDPQEFAKMCKRLEAGLPLSREEARNKVAAAKAIIKDAKVSEKRRSVARRDSSPGLPDELLDEEELDQEAAGDDSWEEFLSVCLPLLKPMGRDGARQFLDRLQEIVETLPGTTRAVK